MFFGSSTISYLPILDPIESQFHCGNLPNLHARRGILLRGYEAHWCPFTKPSEVFILGDQRRGGIFKGHGIVKHESYIVYSLCLVMHRPTLPEVDSGFVNYIGHTL